MWKDSLPKYVQRTLSAIGHCEVYLEEPSYGTDNILSLMFQYSSISIAYFTCSGVEVLEDEEVPAIVVVGARLSWMRRR